MKIEKRDGGSGWRTTCLACTAGRPISREANVLYQYELKRQPVGVRW